MKIPNEQNSDQSNKTPKWVDPEGLKKAAGADLTAQRELKIAMHQDISTVITGYECDTCKVKFAVNQVQKAIKTAARTCSVHIECPECGGILKELVAKQVKNASSAVQGALKLTDKNAPVSRSINTWVDKAIYGRIVNKLGTYIEQFGIFNPQLRFQRGLRTAKFLGNALSARAAEWTVEFVDDNNTRNRIVIQAGVTDNGELIPPKTFKLLSGSEYPLTKEAITALTSGKLFGPASPKAPYRPLTHKMQDPTNFRVISASTKTADQTGMNTQTGVGTGTNMGGATGAPMTGDLQTQLQAMNLDPNDLQQIQSVLQKYDPNNPNAGAGMGGASDIGVSNLGMQGGAGGYNPSPRTSSLNLKKADEFTPPAPITPDQSREAFAVVDTAIEDAANRGLTFEEAFNDVHAATGQFITQEDWDNVINKMQQSVSPMDQLRSEKQMFDAQSLRNDMPSFSSFLNDAQTTYKQSLRKTMADAEKDIEISELPTEVKTATAEVYVNTYNEALDASKSVIDATNLACSAAYDTMNGAMVKLALRDQQTLVPFVDKNPEEEVYLQTNFSEKRFDVPYNETDAGNLPEKERGYLTMFKGKKEGSQKTAYITNENGKYQVHAESGRVLGEHDTKEKADAQLAAVEINKHKASNLSLKKTGEATGLDLSPEEVGQNPINYSRLKQVIFDMIRAGNIPPTKVDLHALKDGKYTLEKLRELIDTFKAPHDTMYPTSHSAAMDKQEKLAAEVAKLAEEKLGDMFKEMPLELKKDQPTETPTKGVDEVGEAPVDEFTALETEVNALLQETSKTIGNVPVERTTDTLTASIHEESRKMYADLISDLQGPTKEDALDPETAQSIQQLKSLEDLKNLPAAPKVQYQALQRQPQIPEGAEVAQAETPEQEALMMEAHVAMREFERAGTSVDDSKQLFWGAMSKVSAEYTKLDEMAKKLHQGQQQVAAAGKTDAAKAQMLDTLMQRYNSVLAKVQDQKSLYQQAQEKYSTLYKTMQQLGAKILRSRDYVAKIVEKMSHVKGFTSAYQLDIIRQAAANAPQINEWLQRVLTEGEKALGATGKPTLQSTELKVGPRSQKGSISTIAMAAEAISALDTLINDVQQLDTIITDSLVELQSAGM